MEALAALDDLVWFRGEPPFDTVDYQGAVTPLEVAVWQQIEAARPNSSHW